MSALVPWKTGLTPSLQLDSMFLKASASSKWLSCLLLSTKKLPPLPYSWSLGLVMKAPSPGKHKWFLLQRAGICEGTMKRTGIYKLLWKAFFCGQKWSQPKPIWRWGIHGLQILGWSGWYWRTRIHSVLYSHAPSLRLCDSPIWVPLPWEASLKQMAWYLGTGNV